MRPRVISDQGNRSAFFKCRRDVECWSSCSVEDVLAKRPREACSAINVHLKELWAHIFSETLWCTKVYSHRDMYILLPIWIYLFFSFCPSEKIPIPINLSFSQICRFGFLCSFSNSSLILCSLIVEVSCVTLLMNLYFADKWKCRVGFCVLLLFFVCFFLCAFLFLFFSQHWNSWIAFLFSWDKHPWCSGEQRMI